MLLKFSFNKYTLAIKNRYINFDISVLLKYFIASIYQLLKKDVQIIFLFLLNAVNTISKFMNKVGGKNNM